MIGDCRYGGPSGSVLPPNSRHAKRLLALLGSARVAGQAIINAVNMVDVVLPSPQSSSESTFDPVLAALNRRRGIGTGADGTAAAPKCPHHERAVRVATSTLRRLLTETVDSMMADSHTIDLYDTRRGMAEERMGLALHLALDRAVDAGLQALAEADNGGNDDTDGNNDDIHDEAQRKRRKASDGDDTDSAVTEANLRFPATSEDRDRTFALRRTASICLESLNLQIMARTTTTWGKKKIYEIYSFPRPVRSVCGEGGVSAVRSAVEKEFRASFRGGGEDQCGIRVYGLLRRICCSVDEDTAAADVACNGSSNEDAESHSSEKGDTYLFLHLCIGKPLDLHDESMRGSNGEKKKKKGNEFIVILRPGTTLFALSASRAPSNSRFTPFVLASLVNALCSNSGGSIDQSLSAERVGDSSGTEPFDLLMSVSSSINGSAIGRYARYAEEAGGGGDAFVGKSGGSAVCDPLVEINKASTGTLLGREAEMTRLETAALHGQSVANLAANITGFKGTSSLVAANNAGLIVDHSAASSRAKRKAGDNDLGREGECPRLDRVCWKWSGDTHAASKCWAEDQDAFIVDDKKKNESQQQQQESTKFKCGVVMEGSDVFGGLRALVASGVAKAPLPNYVRDAAAMGTKTITVADGAFGAADSLAAV